MADFSVTAQPNTSIYAAVNRQQGGLGNMDAGSLLSLVQRGRELQTQQGIADAIRANPDDPEAAYKAAASNPGVFLDPIHQAAFTNAASARFNLNRGYYQETMGALTSLLAKTDPKTKQFNATLDDWNNIAPGLAHMGVPQSILGLVPATADPRTGRLDQTKLAEIASYLTGGKGLPLGTVPGAQPGTTDTGIAARTLFPGTAPAQQPPAAATAPPSVSKSPTEEAKKDVDFGAKAAEQAKASMPAQGLTGSPGGFVAPDENTLKRQSDSIAAYNSDLDRSRQFQNETVPLQKMISIMKKAGPDITGWGKDTWQGIRSAMISLHLPVSSDNTVDYQELRKYMSQQITNAGGRSDYALFSASHANPNTELLQQANLNLAQVLLGLRRKDQYAINEFQRSGLAKTPQLYSEWRSHWDPNIDTTGFVWDQMSDEERGAYAESHSSTPEQVQQLRYSIKATKRGQ